MWIKRSSLVTVLELFALSAAWAAFSLTAPGQTSASEASPSRSQTKLSVPDSGQLLELTVDAPKEVKVGESYQMKATLQNRSKSVDLHDVQLEAKTSGPVEIQSSKVSRSGAGSSSEQKQDSQTQGESSSQKSSSASSGKQEGSKQSDSGQKSWTIKKLAAGESAEIVLQAVGDEEKEAQCCLAVKSFRITSNSEPLCTSTTFIQPELKITKQAPERATLCDVIGFVYVVKNGGSGDVGPFTVEDKLPEGFETESGDKQLKFEVDGLKAGDERKFEAEIRPMKIGAFSSRAVAVAKDSDLKSQSKKVTTKVEGPELAVAIDGPETAPARQPVEYTVRITNNGNQAVDQGLLEIMFPPSAEIEKRSEFKAGRQEAKASQSQGDAPQSASPEQESEKKASGQQPSEGSAKKQKQDRRRLEFSGLQPGDTVQTSFTMTGMEEDTITVTARASYQCQTSEGRETLASSEANTQTKIVAMPALLVTVVDEQDPIQVGKQVVYKIVVKNQGRTADKNLQVDVELPASLKFADATGETSAESKGRQVKFDKVDQLPAGEAVQWTLKATAESQGDARLKVKVKSDGLKEAVESQEPTQLYGKQGGSDSESSSSGNSQN